MRSIDKNFTGKMVGLVRKDSEEGMMLNTLQMQATLQTTYVTSPVEWILPNYQGVSTRRLDHMRPLIKGKETQQLFMMK